MRIDVQTLAPRVCLLSTFHFTGIRADIIVPRTIHFDASFEAVRLPLVDASQELLSVVRTYRKRPILIVFILTLRYYR